MNWKSGNFDTNISYTLDGTTHQESMNLHYWYSPNPGKPKLLFLHGWAEYGLAMKRLAEPFVKEYDILAPDARAHGHSDGPPSHYTINERVDDLDAVLNETDFTPNIIIGHSMGANVGTAAAIRHPEWIKGLVLIDPSWKGGFEQTINPEQEAKYWTRTIHQWKRFSEAQLLRFAQKNFPQWHPEDHEHWVKGKKLIKENTLNGYQHTNPRWDDYIETIPCPGVLVTGDPAKGAIISPETAAASKLRWKGLREIVNIPHAGHYVHHYDVKPIQKALRSLIESVFPLDNETSFR